MGKVILRPHSARDFTINRRAKYFINAIYQDKTSGKWQYIHNSDKNVVKTMTNEEYIKINGKLDVVSLELNYSQPVHVICEVNKSLGAEASKSSLALKNFWLNHPQVTDESGKHNNPNITEVNSIMLFDEDDYANSQIEDDDAIFSARTAFLNLSFEERKAASILFGLRVDDITKENESLMVYRMSSLKEGMITKDISTAKSFLKSVSKITDEVVINSRNAILLNIVIRDGETYYYDNSSLGRKPEDVESYFQNNQSDYNLLVKDLKEKNAFIEIGAKPAKKKPEPVA